MTRHLTSYILHLTSYILKMAQIAGGVIIGGIFGKLIDSFSGIYDYGLRLCGYDITEETASYKVDKIDKYLIKNGQCTSSNLDKTRPADGTHYCLINNKWIYCTRLTDRYATIPVIKYRIVSPDRDITAQFNNTILGLKITPNSIRISEIIIVTCATLQICETTGIIPSKPYQIQGQVINEMWQYYKTHNFNCTALLAGCSNTGKTTTGRFLCEFLKQHKLNPTLPKGLIQQSKG